MPQILQEQLIVDPHNIDNIAEAKIENRYLPTPPLPMPLNFSPALPLPMPLNHAPTLPLPMPLNLDSALPLPMKMDPVFTTFFRSARAAFIGINGRLRIEYQL